MIRSDVNAKILGKPADGKTITVEVVVDGAKHTAWIRQDGSIYPSYLKPYQYMIVGELEKDKDSMLMLMEHVLSRP